MTWVAFVMMSATLTNEKPRACTHGKEFSDLSYPLSLGYVINPRNTGKGDQPHSPDILPHFRSSPRRLA